MAAHGPRLESRQSHTNQEVSWLVDDQCVKAGRSRHRVGWRVWPTGV
jgi:hypothetical protein